MPLREMPGFLGTSAHLLADITLLAYILLLLPLMIVGYLYARRKMFEPAHKLVMTTVVIVNWFLIGFVMIASYASGVAPGVPAALGDVRVWLPTLHLVIGALAQLLGTYLVLRMWFEKQLPEALKVRNIKLYMRFTLGGWVTAAVLGIALYIIWYAAPSLVSGDVPPPVETEEALDIPVVTEEATLTVDETEEVTDEPTEASEEEATLAVDETEEVTDEPTEAPLDPAETEEVSLAPVETEEVVDRDANRARVEALEEELEALEDAADDRDDEALEDQIDALLDRLNDLDERSPDFDTQFAEIEAEATELGVGG